MFQDMSGQMVNIWISPFYGVIYKLSEQVEMSLD